MNIKFQGHAALYQKYTQLSNTRTMCLLSFGEFIIFLLRRVPKDRRICKLGWPLALSAICAEIYLGRFYCLECLPWYSLREHFLSARQERARTPKWRSRALLKLVIYKNKLHFHNSVINYVALAVSSRVSKCAWTLFHIQYWYVSNCKESAFLAWAAHRPAFFLSRAKWDDLSNFSLSVSSCASVLFFPLPRVAVSEMHFERERLVPVGI